MASHPLSPCPMLTVTRETEKWSSPLTFPSDPQAASSGDLITVTDLVKQGLVPLTMGMVLCDGQRPGEIDRFVRFVASLHSTGTVRSSR